VSIRLFERLVCENLERAFSSSSRSFRRAASLTRRQAWK